MTQTNHANPLKQYFRQPAIYIRLPSKGEFYPPDTLIMPPNGEIPVLPMTAVDEITYRTPDALFNGSAVVNVIQSCVPHIRDAWAVPAMDVDTILVAIRIASYGHTLEMTTQCPSCKTDEDYGLDLRQVLDQMKSPDYTKSIQYRDIELFFKPMNYKNLNDNNAMQFEEQRILGMLPDTEIPDQDKMAALSAALKKITEITVRALAQSISTIKTPNALVTEPEYIEEFLQNCDRGLFNQIRDHIINIKNESEIKPVTIKCAHCSHEYEQPMTLDMTSFFAAAS
jgi:hypothetical protein